MKPHSTPGSASMRWISSWAVAGILASLGTVLSAAPAAPRQVQSFIEKHCVDCHDLDTKKGGLDLTTLQFDVSNPQLFNQWVIIHDRVAKGEMPPKKQERPEAGELGSFIQALGGRLTEADEQRAQREGRSTQRRLNRYEYENALRDLLHAPWLQIRDSLPEDGEAYRFNKSGDALDVSHVQMARYLAAADYALRQAIATQVARPETRTVRYYARE